MGAVDVAWMLIATELVLMMTPALGFFYGGLLISDALGQPIEFVHTSAVTPSGVLWPEDEARDLAHCRIAHSLFDACQRSPASAGSSRSRGLGRTRLHQWLGARGGTGLPEANRSRGSEFRVYAARTA